VGLNSNLKLIRCFGISTSMIHGICDEKSKVAFVDIRGVNVNLNIFGELLEFKNQNHDYF